MNLKQILNYKNNTINQEIKELENTNNYIINNHNSFHNFNLVLSKIFSFDWRITNNAFGWM